MLAAKYFAVEISMSIVQSIPSKYFDADTTTQRANERSRKTIQNCCFFFFQKNSFRIRFEIILVFYSKCTGETFRTFLAAIMLH